MFKLIKRPRSDNDKYTKYDVVLDKEYTVEEFIDAIADGRNGTHGQITIKNDKEAIESLVYNIESKDKNGKYNQKNKKETQKGALRFIVKKPDGEESVVVIFRNKSDGTYSFVNLTKEHICSCKFKTIDEAIQDMNDRLKKGLIESYVMKGERK